jgi:hypothetical protein
MNRASLRPSIDPGICMSVKTNVEPPLEDRIRLVRISLLREWNQWNPSTLPQVRSRGPPPKLG